MGNLLADITTLFAKHKIRQELRIESPQYQDLPENVRADLQSGDEKRTRQAYEYMIKHNASALEDAAQVVALAKEKKG